MSTYELDDELVRQFTSGNPLPRAWETLTEELRGQLPIEVPTKVSAIVRTKQGTLWTLAACGCHWISQYDVGGEHATRTRGELGSVAEVLFEGVDL